MEQITKEMDSKSVSEFTLCPTHKMNNIYIDLNMSKGYALKCTKCLIQQKINNNQLLPLEEVKYCEDKTIFDNWPFFEDNNKVNQILNKFIDLTIEQIEYFFKSFRSQIYDQIDQIESKYIEQLIKLDENKKMFTQYYNKVSQKKQLKESVTNLQKDFNSSVYEIDQIIKNHNYQMRQNDKSNLQLIHDQFMYYSDYLSIENMNTFKLEIQKSLNMMKEIVNYEFVDILKEEESSGKFIVNQNKNYFNNKVFCCSKQFLYSKQQLQTDNNLYKHINNYNQLLSSYHNENSQLSKQAYDKEYGEDCDDGEEEEMDDSYSQQRDFEDDDSSEIKYLLKKKYCQRKFL